MADFIYLKIPKSYNDVYLKLAEKIKDYGSRLIEDCTTDCKSSSKSLISCWNMFQAACVIYDTAKGNEESLKKADFLINYIITKLKLDVSKVQIGTGGDPVEDSGNDDDDGSSNAPGWAPDAEEAITGLDSVFNISSNGLNPNNENDVITIPFVASDNIDTLTIESDSDWIGVEELWYKDETPQIIVNHLETNDSLISRRAIITLRRNNAILKEVIVVQESNENNNWN